MSYERGFTLIELLVTIGIISTLTAIAALYVPDMLTNYRVSGAVRSIYSDMQMARLRAIREGKEFQVDFTPGSTIYVVKIKNGATIKTVDISSDYSGVTLCNNLTDAEFNPNGTASGSVAVFKGSRFQRVFISSTGTGNIRLVNLNACP